MFASLDLAAEPQLRLTELIAALTRNAVDFVVIGGETKSGKTMLALNIISNLLQCN